MRQLEVLACCDCPNKFVSCWDCPFCVRECKTESTQSSLLLQSRGMAMRISLWRSS